MFPIESKKATAESVGRLPVSTITEATLKSLQDRGDLMECSVCLEPFAVGDECKAMPCFHQFHVACLDKWLKECKSNQCYTKGGGRSEMYSICLY